MRDTTQQMAPTRLMDAQVQNDMVEIANDASC